MKKSRHRRTPKHQVSRRQRADAIEALHRTVENPNAPEYTKIKAASAIINAARIDDDGLPERDPNEPRKYVILPAKGDPNERYGLYDDDQLVVIVPRGFPAEVQPEGFYKDVPKPLGVVDENALCRVRAEARRACYCEFLGEVYDPKKPLPYWPYPTPGSNPDWEAEVERRVDEAEGAERRRLGLAP